MEEIGKSNILHMDLGLVRLELDRLRELKNMHSIKITEGCREEIRQIRKLLEWIEK